MFRSFPVALAAAAFCAADAHAQSSVTLYGILDTFVEYADNGAGTLMRLESGGPAASRWGLRGREDLGSGLAAVFTLEAGLSADTGALGNGGLAWGRQAFVGLTDSRYGSLTFGRQYTPVHTVMASYALGGLGLGYANAANSFYYNPATVARNDNSVLYVSPRLGGFLARAMVSPGEGATGKAASASLNYELGRFSAAGVYYQSDAPRGTLGTAATNPDDKLKLMTVGASYDLGFLKMGALYADMQNEVSAFAVDQSWWSLSVTFPVGAAGSLLVDVGQLTDRALANGDATSLGVRYDHSLSKRTILYAGAHKMRNESAAGYRTNGAGNTGVPLSGVGADPTSVVMGVQHRF